MSQAAVFLTHPFSRALALALLHFLWQGALVAMLLAAADAILTRASARARYGAACAAMVLMLLLPALTVWRIAGRRVATPAGVSLVFPPQRVLPTAGNAAGRATDTTDRIAAASPWIVLGWTCGVLLLSIRLLGGFLTSRRLVRRATRRGAAPWERRLVDLAARLRVSQPVRLLESSLIEVPAAVGILRPVILLPAGIVTGLCADQIDSLLAHELAHIRRRDCLMNLLQALAETLLFYHPAVWWVSHRVRIERENACDDLAVAVTGDAATYARALVALEERRQPALRLAVAADGGSLWDRVARLFPAPESEARRAPRWMAAALALGGVLALGAAARVPIQEKDPTVSASPLAPVTRPAPESPRAPGAAAASTTTTAPRRTSEAKPAKGESAAPAEGLLSPQQLIQFKIHGVTPEFIGGIVALGYDRASPDELLALRIHGVTPEYIAAMTATFGKLPLEKYTAFRIHGLTPETVKQLQGSFGKLSSDEALAMRIHGVTPEFVAGFRAAGFESLSAEEAVALRIHGATPEFGRAMKTLGIANLAAEQLIAFRIHGVTPEFVQEVHAAGYTNISADDLVAFRIHGVSPESIGEMNRKAGRRLPANTLLERQIHESWEEKEEKEVEP